VEVWVEDFDVGWWGDVGGGDGVGVLFV